MSQSSANNNINDGLGWLFVLMFFISSFHGCAIYNVVKKIERRLDNNIQLREVSQRPDFCKK